MLYMDVMQPICELVIQLDSTTDPIRIPLSLTESEIRNLFPKLLSVSRLEDNPMITFENFINSPAASNYPDNVKQEYAEWTRNMAKYWYEKSSTSLFDVALGMAIDLKLNNISMYESDDLPEDSYMGVLSNPIVRYNNTKDMSMDEVESFEKKYDVEPDEKVKMSLNGTDTPYSDSTADPRKFSVSIYGDDSVDNFISDEIDEKLSNKVKDIVSTLTEKDYSDYKKNYSVTYAGRGFFSGQELDIDKKTGRIIDANGKNFIDEDVDEMANALNDLQDDLDNSTLDNLTDIDDLPMPGNEPDNSWSENNTNDNEVSFLSGFRSDEDDDD